MHKCFELADAVASVDDLMLALNEISDRLGFQFFAVSQHVDLPGAATCAIRIHNYPPLWQSCYDENGFGGSDPVHRASHVTSVGFRWSHMANMIPLTPMDRRILALGRAQGIGDGFTVPANVPGEIRGSCSFANGADRPLPHAMLPMAQLAGAFAFEAARRLWLGRGHLPVPNPPALTDRQRDCLYWVARGKGDWEIAQILHLSVETVAQHIKQACERYGVNKRTLLLTRAYADGTLILPDSSGR